MYEEHKIRKPDRTILPFQEEPETSGFKSDSLFTSLNNFETKNLFIENYSRFHLICLDKNIRDDL